jgi:Domain of unknown function (DUF4333)
MRVRGVAPAVVLSVVAIALGAWTETASAASINANASVVTKTIDATFARLPSNPPVKSVKCPSKKVSPGAEYTCKAVIDGQKVPVSVKVLDTVPVTVEATPTEAVVNVARAEGRIEGLYYAKTGVAVSAECPDNGGKAYLVVEPGTTISCQLVGTNGPIGDVDFTATDVNEGWASTGLPA